MAGQAHEGMAMGAKHGSAVSSDRGHGYKPRTNNYDIAWQIKLNISGYHSRSHILDSYVYRTGFSFLVPGYRTGVIVPKLIGSRIP